MRSALSRWPAVWHLPRFRAGDRRGRPDGRAGTGRPCQHREVAAPGPEASQRAPHRGRELTSFQHREGAAADGDVAAAQERRAEAVAHVDLVRLAVAGADFPDSTEPPVGPLDQVAWSWLGQPVVGQRGALDSVLPDVLRDLRDVCWHCCGSFPLGPTRGGLPVPPSSAGVPGAGGAGRQAVAQRREYRTERERGRNGPALQALGWH